ncbi:MAG: hypothetical protein JJU02_10485 [Cryomorphaceae bacterium]|nr:hypothetical protein [Cryomorphaceae bacterium]
MNNTQIRLCIIFLATLFVCAECFKKPLVVFTMPPITDDGAHTMAMKVNGDVWLPYPAKERSWGGTPFQGANLVESPNSDWMELTIDGRQDFRNVRDPPQNSRLIITIDLHEIPAFKDTFYFEIGGSISATFNYEEKFHRSNSNDEKKSWLHFHRFDTIENIISGTFRFDVTAKGDVLKLREGRFDLVYEERDR